MHVEAIHGAGIRGERHELGRGGLDVQVVDQDADPASERGGGAHHALGLVEHDAGLIARGGGRVDLGALLAIGDQQIERDTGREGALAVLAGDGAIRGAEAAQAIGALPAEQAADDERLPGRETEGLACPLAFAVAQEAEEGDGVAGRLEVEAQASTSATLKIIQVALAGQADETVRQNLPPARSSARPSS
jgi:hypothetical protein